MKSLARTLPPNSHGPASASLRQVLRSGADGDESWQSWQWQQRHRLTSLESVLALLETEWSKTSRVMRPVVRARMLEAAQEFPFAVTPYYLSLADPRDPRDPILPQVLPDPAETAVRGRADPFDEQGLQIAPGLVHRYPDRVLFLLTNYCSTLCRHCMRKREWKNPFGRLSDAEVDAAVEAIRVRPQIRDVLISGGDPLNLGAAFVHRVLQRLRERTDVDCIRFGSRVPVTLPQRIDDEMIAALEPHAPLFLNTHFNHIRELTPEAVAAVRRLTRAGVVVSNQAVLLRGVNDRPEDLLALSRGLLRAGVRAYYLHHCDPVDGAEHFRVGLGRARGLVNSLYGKVSGLAIPRLMVDLPGGGGKVDASGDAKVAAHGFTEVFRSPLDGREIEVDGAEGGFAGVSSWLQAAC